MFHILRFITNHPLTRDHKLKAGWRVLDWQIRSRVKSEVSVPWIAGTTLLAKHGMTGASGNIYAGLHEFPDMAFVLHFLRPGDLFIDVGANIGSYTILASGVCKARSVSFEPDPETAISLSRNVDANGLGSLVTVNVLAAGAESGQVLISTGRDTMNHILPSGSPDSRLVDQVSLDDALSNENPAMIKADVEGYEEEVLKGAAKALTKPSLSAIASEKISPFIKETLETAGFSRAYYDPFERKMSDSPTVWRQSNALFVRNTEFVRDRLHSAPPITVLGNVI